MNITKSKKYNQNIKPKTRIVSASFKKSPMPTFIMRNNKRAFAEGHSCTQQIKSHQPS